MPVFMDRYRLPGAAAKDVADVHQKELHIQHKFGCRALSYWFDEQQEAALSLIEAPNKEALLRMHRQASIVVPHQVVEVKKELLEAFLGWAVDGHAGAGADRFPFSAPGPAIMMAVAFPGLFYPPHSVNSPKEERAVSERVSRVKRIGCQFGGCELESQSAVLVIGFSSIVDAVDCALILKKSFTRPGEKGKAKEAISIGLSMKHPPLPGNVSSIDTLKLAKRLCMAAGRGMVLASASVRSAYPRYKHWQKTRPAIKILNVREENFLNSLMEVTESCWNDPGMTIALLARKIGISKAQLYRQLVSLQGMSPLDFIKAYRLQKAFFLLEVKAGSVADIAYETGFNSASYFSKCFQKAFGVLPSKWASAPG